VWTTPVAPCTPGTPLSPTGPAPPVITRSDSIQENSNESLSNEELTEFYTAIKFGSHS